MTREELNTYIDTNITNKTAVNSLTPTNEGNALKAVANYADQELETKENSENKSTGVNLGESNVLFPTQNAVKTYVDQKIATVKPYKVYSILISQSGTNDPLVTTLLENTFEGDITWARISTGLYEGTITTTEFTNLKTGFIITPIGVDLNCASSSPTSSTVRIQTWVPSSVAFADGQLNETFYEIRVYP